LCREEERGDGRGEKGEGGGSGGGGGEGIFTKKFKIEIPDSRGGGFPSSALTGEGHPQLL
jgi:hypothetical protein